MGRSDPNSQIDLAHLAIWARRAPPGPATYLLHPTHIWLIQVESLAGKKLKAIGTSSD